MSCRDEKLYKYRNNYLIIVLFCITHPNDTDRWWPLCCPTYAPTDNDCWSPLCTMEIHAATGGQNDNFYHSKCNVISHLHHLAYLKIGPQSPTEVEKIDAKVPLGLL